MTCGHLPAPWDHGHQKEYSASFPGSSSRRMNGQWSSRACPTKSLQVAHSGPENASLRQLSWKTNAATSLRHVSQNGLPAASKSPIFNSASSSSTTRQSTTETVGDEPADGSSLYSSVVSTRTSATSHDTSCWIPPKPEAQPAQQTTPTHDSREDHESEEDPFDNPIQIPGVAPSTLVYPHSAPIISEAFRERYCEIINLFRQNTEEHPRLRDHVRQIDYTLKMCGPSADKSHPSILVFCRPSEFSSLQSLLNSKHLKLQYCVRQSTPKYFWQSWRGKGTSTVPEVSHKPLFRLYFWRQARPRTLLKFEETTVFLDASIPSLSITRPRSNLTLCGAGISTSKGRRRISTLGCVIRVGSELYGLTAAHAVRPLPISEYTSSLLDEEAVEDIGISSANSTATDPDDESLEDDDFIDDVEYLDLSEKAYSEDEQPDTPGIEIEHNIEDREKDQDYSIETTALFPYEQAQDSDLDWALVRLPDKECWLPNIIVLGGKSGYPVYISDVASSCPIQETNILIINSTNLPVSGKLQPVPAFLGGINGNRPSTVWSVILSDRHGK